MSTRAQLLVMAIVAFSLFFILRLVRRRKLQGKYALLWVGVGLFLGIIALDGEIPLNTNGGQLSGGRLHGYGFLHEACVQLWGEGGARQVPGDPRVAVAAAGGGPLGGCLLLVRD